MSRADQIIVTDDNPRSESSSEIITEILSGIPDFPTSRVVVEADRKAAIKLAFENADADDWILIAGKGHEDYQLVGDQRLPFSDREIARELLAGSAS